MNDSTTYKTSDSTPFKQESLRFLLWQHMDIVKTIWRKYTGIDEGRPYRYFDLHGGYGKDENGEPGSPLIFHEVATEHDIPYQAIVFEREKAAYDSLVSHIGHLDNFRVMNEDHTRCIAEYSKPVTKEKQKVRKHQYGIVYSDPSNADPSFDVLSSISSAYPKVDIVINIAATSYKRTSHLDDYMNLKDRLLEIKDVWIIRKPLNNQQWTMLLGTSWVAFPDWEEKEFFRFDTERGRHWFDEVAYTKRELHENQYSNTLFDSFDDEPDDGKKKVNIKPTQNT